MMALALYQPEIAQNTGTLLRTTACLGVPLHIIRPCGYPLGVAQLKRAAMDYRHQARCELHDDWPSFYQQMMQEKKILVLATPYASCCFTSFVFSPEHVLLLGKESTGVPLQVASECSCHISIPMKAHTRSLILPLAVQSF